MTHLSTGQTAQIDCLSLHSLPSTWLPLTRRELRFYIRITKNIKTHDFILVAVDRFFKMAHFILYSKTAYASCVVAFFFDHVVKLHGLPKIMVLDRDIKFVS